MSAIIEVKNLGKKYTIGEKEHYLAMRDVLMNIIKSPLNWLKSKAGGVSAANEFWALKDLNFTVGQGEVLGIIGRNGAGKSTLLKILSQITPPTIGEIRLKGRVGSLLEVGTGFHPELTGRENIYLNGAILGMRKKEIEKKFDEIVAFSGIEKFLDTPVKRYSSGMYVRLAFSVAAHLEPDILIIDEVLAVGDAEFQKKCLGKMEDVTKKDGRTVLFVSHNMNAIKKLCNRSILLEGGTKKIEGATEDVINSYLNTTSIQNSFSPIYVKEIDVVVTKIVINEDNKGNVFPGKPLRIDIEMDATRDVEDIGLLVSLSHEDISGSVFSSYPNENLGLVLAIKKGKNRFTCIIERFNLCSGRYRLGFGISKPFVKYYYYETDLFGFDVIETMFEHSRLPTSPIYGHVYLDHHWLVQR